MIKTLSLIFYYGIAKRFPTQPMLGWQFGYWLRRKLIENIVESCGEGIIVKKILMLEKEHVSGSETFPKLARIAKSSLM